NVNVQGIRITTAFSITLSGTATAGINIGSSGINLTYTTGTGTLANGGNPVYLGGSIVFVNPITPGSPTPTSPRLNMTGTGKVIVGTNGLNVDISGGAAGPTLQIHKFELNTGITYTVAGTCNFTVVDSLSLLGTSKLILPNGSSGSTRNFTIGGTGGSGVVTGTGTLSVGATMPTVTPAIVIGVGTGSDLTLRFSDLPTTSPTNNYFNAINIQRSGVNITIDGTSPGTFFAGNDIRTSGTPTASGNITINFGSNVTVRLQGQSAISSVSAATSTNLVFNASTKLIYARSNTPWTFTNIGSTTPESSITINVPELEFATTGTGKSPSFSSNGNTTLNGRLTFSTTDQNVATNRRLIIGSGGSIGALSTGSSVSGDVTVQRILPAGRRRNIFLSSAVTARIDTSWQQQIHITGTGTAGTICPSLTPHTNGFDATLNNTASMFTYNPTAAAG
ncbi:MAG TPA: hypothetical protein DCL43_01795, partial [Chitinophagaceae bacterium]|nr:hypothetical protein [Chitinophagaceae bacterium]